MEESEPAAGSVAHQVAAAVGAVPVVEQQPIPTRPATPPPSSSSSSSASAGPSSSTPPQQQIRSSAPSPSDSPAAAASARPTTASHSTPQKAQQSSSSSSPSHQQAASTSSSGASSSSPGGGSNSQGNARRVKLYRLHDDAWIDLGTGNCAVHFIEPAAAGAANGATTSKDEEGAWIIVKREQPKEGASSSQGEGGEAGEMILRSKVMPYPPGYISDDEDEEEDELRAEGVEGRVEDIGGYQRQQDTLIVWTDRELEMEMALSFATSGGCKEIWDFIRAARKWAQDQPLTSPSPSPSLSSPQPFPHYSTAPHLTKLPEPSLGNISLVESTIRAMARTAVGRERTASTIIKMGLVQKLIKVQEEAEDLESLEDLHALCRVMQTILLLNDNVIFDLILRDEIILGVASILEYDPEFPTLKASYRAHLSDPTHFKLVVPIRSPALLAKIHQTHRLHYLKDVVLARILEDSTFSMLNSAIYFNEVDIVNEIAGDHDFLKELFAIFDDEDAEGEVKLDKGKGKETIGPQLPSTIGPQLSPSAELTNGTSTTPSSSAVAAADDMTPVVSPSSDRKHDAILFLQSFALMAKNLQLPLRAAFFRSLADRGLLRVIEMALTRDITREDPQMRGAVIAILMSLVDHDSNNVRGYSLKRKNEGEAGKEGAGDKDKAEAAGTGTGTGPGSGGSKPLMEFLIELFIGEEDLGLKAQMSEALRVLVDAGGEGGPLEAPPRMRQEDPEAEKFLQYFYDHCTSLLFKPLLCLPDRAPGDPPLPLNATDIALFTHLCDLLCFFISHHSFRSKYFVLSSHVGTHVAKLFATKHKHLKLAALRFFRATLGKMDDFFNRDLIKKDLFRPILDVVWEEREKDNLLASAGLEFFEFVRTSNAKNVINHLLERYSDRVRQLAATLPTFKSLIAKWEQNNEPPPATSTKDSSSSSISTNGATSKSMVRETSSWSRMEVEQEDSYFNGSDDEDEDLPGPQPLAHQPTAAPSSFSAAGQGAAPSSLPADAARNPRKREATSSDDDRPPSSPSSAATTAFSATSASASSSADRGKRLRLEKTQSEAELGCSEGGITRSQSWPPGAGGAPLVDYGGDDSDEDVPTSAVSASTSAKGEEQPAGGFVREGDEPMRELKPPEKEEDGPPIPPKRRKDDDDDDGELGLLSKGASKKVHLSPSASATKSASSGPKLGTFSFGGVGSKTVGSNGPVGGAIKISLGIKSSLSKLAGGGGGDSKKEKKEKEGKEAGSDASE